MKKVKRLLIISRPIYWGAVTALYWMGVVSGHHQRGSSEWLGLAFFTFPMGMIAYGLNDVADYEYDKRNPRKGLIDGAIIKPAEINGIVTVTAILLIIFELIFISKGLLLPALFILIITGLSYLYSFWPIRLKNRPILDSSVNGFWLGLVFLTGLTINQSSSLRGNFSLKLLAASFLCGFAFHALGAVLDFGADKKVKQQTIATFLGLKRTSLITLVCLIPCFLLIDPSFTALRIFFGLSVLMNLLICINPTSQTILGLKAVFFSGIVIPLPILFILTNLS